jgi:hypothetical protein
MSPRVIFPGLAIGGTGKILAGNPSDGSWLAGAVSVAVHVAAGVGALVVMLLLATLAKALAGRPVPRPRWHYAVLSAAYLGCAAGVYVVGAAALAASGWAGSVIAVLLAWSVAGAIAMFGRAIFRGRARRLFWWYQPQWLSSSSDRA